MKTTIIDWVLARLSENSTWRGLILVLTSTGVIITPELATHIVAAGLALVGIINIVRKAPKSETSTSARVTDSQ